MANHSFSFPVESFGKMQPNMSQHLQPQQPIAGVPDAHAHGWSEFQEQFRISNSAVGGPQAPPGSHQMNQQHPGMPQNMNLMGNQGLGSQMQRQTPQMQHAVMNAQNQYQQQQQQAAQQQQRFQINQNNLMSNMAVNSNASAAAAHLMQGRQNIALFPSNPTNMNPAAIQAQLHKINNGIAPGQVQLQRPSVSSSQTAVLQQSSAQCPQFEQRMNTVQEQARLAIQNGNISQMRQARDAAAEVQRKSGEERERWMAVFQTVRANGGSTDNDVGKQVTHWFTRYQTLYDRSDRMVKALEQAMQNANAQQNAQQQQQQQQNATNAAMTFAAHNARASAGGINPGNAGTNTGNNAMNVGMTGQQQWNGLQREAAANQGVMHSQPAFAAQPNRSALNAMTYNSNNNTTFPNSSNPPPATDFQSRPPQPQPGMTPMNNAPPEQNAGVKDNFMKFLSMQNVDPTVIIAGHQIELWDLWHAARRYDTMGQPPNHAAKWHMVGAHLGLPIDPQSGHTIAKELQEHHARVSVALQSARMNPQARPPHQTAQMNAMMLQTAIKNYPHVDFSGITQDIIVNLPIPRFEHRIRTQIAEPTGNNNNPVNANTPHTAPRTPVPGTFMVANPRIPTPVNHDPNNNGQTSRLNQFPPLNVEEIMKLHEQCQSFWRRTYDNITLQTFTMPNNLSGWKEGYRQAMDLMKPIIMGMGLYLHIHRDKEEMHNIITKSVLLIKQRQMMGTHLLFSLQTIDETINYFRPRQQQFQARIQERVRSLPGIPPVLAPLINPSDQDFSTLGGLLPPATLAPAQPAPIGRTTPVPPVAVPTPPQHLGGPPTTLGGRGGRRGAFSDTAGSISSPSFQTSPAAVPNSTSPPASSPPKAAKVNRPRPQQKRKQSKATNTPTPAAEPASTPTPAAAPTPAPTTLKRSIDDAEIPSAQAGPSQHKRVKTEPSPPPAPPKPATPPPQISTPINGADIRTPEDAKDLLAEVFKKAEEQKAISQSQGESDDFMQWLSQIISGSNDSGPSTLANDIGSLVGLTNEADSQVDGADVDFFDYNAYYPDADGPTVPELDKRATLSPESHNDATTTPPSQTTAPARAGGKTGEQKAAVNGTSVTTSVKVEAVQVESDLRYFNGSSFLAGFSYDGAIDSSDEPWAIK